jgi:hypothetical protein
MRSHSPSWIIGYFREIGSVMANGMVGLVLLAVSLHPPPTGQQEYKFQLKFAVQQSKSVSQLFSMLKKQSLCRIVDHL